MAKNGAVYKTSGSLLKIFSVLVIIAAIALIAVAFITKHSPPVSALAQKAAPVHKSVNKLSSSLVPATTKVPGSGSGSQNTPRSTGHREHTSTDLKKTTVSTSTGLNSNSGELTVTSVSPPAHARGVDPLTHIVITFSQPLSHNSPMPTLTPSTAGSWAIAGNQAIFTPTVPFIPLSDVTISVKNTLSPITSASGATLTYPVTSNFIIRTGSTLRIQQLLSELDYSPLSFTSASPLIAAGDEAGQISAFYNPPSGQFTWRQTTWPGQLTQLWQAGVYNTMTKGLIMEFQADHGLIVNGRETAGLFNDLLQAITNNELNSGGYNYALVNKTPPENLTIWHNGKVVITTPANTGIATDPTTDGTYPVFAKYRYQVMHGTNPDGSHYADPVQFVSYFHGGEAVHYMPRPDYGIPQSLGCVELPLSSAAQVWPWLAYGTLVTIIN